MVSAPASPVFRSCAYKFGIHTNRSFQMDLGGSVTINGRLMVSRTMHLYSPYKGQVVPGFFIGNACLSLHKELYTYKADVR